MIALASERRDWAVGYQDETWWSRLARPALHSWTDGDPLRLVEPAVAADDPDPKALACYGLLVRPGHDAPEAVWLRFVDGRPVSALTTAFLDWCCGRLATQGVTTLVLVWDNASWHLSGEVRRWLRAHNQQAHRQGGVRLVPCRLPSKSPWLNPIEPKWVHGKRAILEPDRKLSGDEVIERVCGYYGCEQLERLVQQVA